jgi:hypothetical protein
MPHNTTWEPKGVHWEFYGVVSFSEIAEANAEFYSNERSDRMKYQIFDSIGVDAIVGTEAELKMLAAIDVGASKSIKSIKVALVIVKEELMPLAEGYVATSEALMSSWFFKIFSSLEEAREWVEAV